MQAVVLARNTISGRSVDIFTPPLLRAHVDVFGGRQLRSHSSAVHTTKSGSIGMGPSRLFRAGELRGQSASADHRHDAVARSQSMSDRYPLYRVDHFAHAVAVALTTVIRRPREDGRVREGGWRQVMVGNLNLPNTPMGRPAW